MKQALLALLVLGGLASPVAAQRQRLSPQAARYGWSGDYQQARELARKTGKPIFLVFRCVP